MKRFLKVTFILLLFVAAGIFIGLAINEQYPYIKAKQIYKEIQAEFVIPAVPDPDEESDGESGDTQEESRAIDFNQLRSKYPNAIGWIYVPGTQIDYPICKGTDDFYYLTHTPSGQYNKLGAIYVPANTSEALSDAHTVIYGHNMKSGQMFGELSNYTSETFRNNHPTVYIYTPDKTFKCVVYNAYTCIGGDENYYIEMEFGSDKYEDWLEQSSTPLAYSKQYVALAPDVQTFSLSTCSDSGPKKNRYIVHCIVTSVLEDY